MKGGKQPQGYTIVEVLIVLAVSGLMFVIAANFINGKHEKSVFSAGINEMASRLQDTIEQVTDGQYSDIDLNCAFSGTISFPPGPVHQQGKNPECVFLGKVLHFAENNSTHYGIFSIAGGRLNAGVPITDLGMADPTVIPPLTKHLAVAQSLEAQKITVDGAISSFGVGFFQGQGTVDSDDNYLSGKSPVKLYYIDTLGINKSSAFAQSMVDAGLGTNVKPAKSIDLCFSDGVQSAHLLLGSNGNNDNALSVRVKRTGPAAC